MEARTAIGTVLVAIAAVAGSCGDEDTGDGPAPPPASPDQEVVLSLDRDSPHPGETLELTVENRTKTRLEYGLVYRLERRIDDGWRWINKDAAFALILKGVEPGKREREDIGLPDDLTPDRYRIVKEFRAPTTGREHRADVEFTVSGL